MRYTCGVDIGASAAKLVILDEERRPVATVLRSSGVDYAETAEACLAEALAAGGLTKEDVRGSLATGYGRDNVPWADGKMTEIACHGKGAYFHYPRAITVIDIGAQDNKVIRLVKDGRRLSFKMNRKCAAGTGAFLEEIALRLDLSVSELNGLAERSTKEVALGSFCTVFTATEILAKIRAGEKVEDIVKGAFRSVVKRILEMEVVDGPLVLTGGVVAHNPFLANLVEESFGNEVLVPPEPQHVGALGAALVALENSGTTEH
ncbi:MAG: acyl-CoA dehydratase activase [Planctomycetota bacterium]|jgi:predicted CoA-substrate-specific enzyme activase